MLIKKIRNKILKEMRLEQKEKFIQCLVGAGVWDEINVRR